MPILETIKAIHEYTRDRRNAYHANNEKLFLRLADVFSRTWDLGLTAFGGPPVHFGIFHQRFVDGHGGKTPWIDQVTVCIALFAFLGTKKWKGRHLADMEAAWFFFSQYQELFALCQSLPGPASTKMLFCMALIHAGFVPAVFVFFLWSLPGAIGMFALSLGIQNIGNVLPSAVYALLSGLNAATVGLVALAAVQLAEKAIRDSISRILVIFGACAGLCYSGLWYFPVIIIAGGITTTIWDVYLRQAIAKWKQKFKARRARRNQVTEESTEEIIQSVDTTPYVGRNDDVGLQRRVGATRVTSTETSNPADVELTQQSSPAPLIDPATIQPSTDMASHGISVTTGLIIVVVFFATFTAVLVARGVVDAPPLAFNLFANMYLAGTIIFGGGPVVIPLLREYVVQPGWVSSRDFLIGLAIIQAFPGPNFNFSVYLGALALAGGSHPPTIVGALISYIGIFLPGLTLAIGAQGFWRVLRTKPVFTSLLRGINATAVGLVFTAVYRLWEMGYLTAEDSSGQSLANEPWWVVVTVVTYAECAWFKVPPPIGIVIGAVLGLGWYGAVGRN